MSKTSIVTGLFFGDEGKGITTAFLSSPQSLVVRFSGGHNAGHTVETNRYRHIFSSFGAGTLRGAHTYWSEFCTFCPKSFFNEREALLQNGYDPVHFIHPLTMITTPFDYEHNQRLESVNNHGSVGVGLGATIARHMQTPFKLFAIDLEYRPLLFHKLQQIATWYKADNVTEKIGEFLWYVEQSNLSIKTLTEIKDRYEHIIFEGAQGIMLDMDFGFFPNVTRSNTTSKNAMDIIQKEQLPLPDIYYVMRAYLTRHGNGYMPNETAELCFEDKTNTTHPWQGKFRQGYHATDLLQHAMHIDSVYTGNEVGRKKLVITCVDQTGEMIYIDNKQVPLFDFLETPLPVSEFFINRSPKAGALEPVKFQTMKKAHHF
jgi:adenylosuccinate synthase